MSGERVYLPTEKNKGNIQSSNNYRGIKLITYTMEAVGKLMQNDK